jgi:hypothetical protein
MAINYELSTKTQLESLGIQLKVFNEFYEALKRDNVLPGKGIYGESYEPIVNYLTEIGVLKGKRIIKKGIKLLDSKRNLEALIEISESIAELDDNSIGNSGGILPCIPDDTEHGGIMPCHSRSYHHFHY